MPYDFDKEKERNNLMLMNFNAAEIDSMLNHRMELYYLKDNSFSLKADNQLVFYYYGKHQYLIYDILNDTFIGSRDLIICVILKPFNKYKHVLEKPELFSDENFNPVKFSYETPGNSRPVYLITMYTLDSTSGNLEVTHYGTYDELTRDKLFHLYGFTESKNQMNEVKTLMSQLETINPNDDSRRELATEVAWKADYAATGMNNSMEHVIQGQQKFTPENITSRVKEINVKISDYSNPVDSSWKTDENNHWMIDAVMEMVGVPTNAMEKWEAAREAATAAARVGTEAEAAVAARVAKAAAKTAAAKTAAARVAKARVAKAAAPVAKAAPPARAARFLRARAAPAAPAALDMTISTTSQGGKRRKTKRKSKTHKRKSNKKMRRSRKSRRRRR